MADPAREAARAARNALHRQLVFEAAERAFAEKGVEDTKMEEIAAEAGVALGTLYNVFSGKAQLVAAGEFAFPGHGKQSETEEEVRRLRRELSIARQERDILKKAAAYFANDKS